MPKQTSAPPRRRGNGKRATLTEALDRLDRERASSLADEGGTAGAAVEAQRSQPETVAPSTAGKLLLAASWGLAGLAALYLRRSR